MDKYIVSGFSARISSGVLELTEAQAKARSHNLETLGGGLFRVINPVEFKNNEVIGYDGELPRAMGEVLVKEQPLPIDAEEGANPVKKKKQKEPDSAEVEEGDKEKAE